MAVESSCSLSIYSSRIAHPSSCFLPILRVTEKSVHSALTGALGCLRGSSLSRLSELPHDTRASTEPLLSALLCWVSLEISPSKLISHRFPLEDIEKGFHIMRDKSEDYIKAMAEFPRPCTTKDFTVLPDSIKNKESPFYIER